MSTEIPFPYVFAGAMDPFERGRIVGAQAAQRIRRSIAIYAQVFAHYARLPWSAVRELAGGYVDPIADYDPAIIREIEGIAGGAGLPPEDIVALNARSEIMFGLGDLAPRECTAFFAGPTATTGGEVLLGENWDWLTRSRECTVLVELDQGADLPALAMLPEAGLVGKMGLNSNGIGVTVNALQSSADHGAPCVPIHVILRGILSSPTFDQAVEAITRAPRGASASYTIASAEGQAIAIEGGPGGVESAYLIEPTNDLLSHCNHFLADTGFADTGLPGHPDSLTRLAGISAFLDVHRGELSAESVKRILRSEAHGAGPICRQPNPALHPAEDVSTAASVVMNLTDRTLELTDGPPAGQEYCRFKPRFAKGAA